MMICLTHEVSERINDCHLTYLDPRPIDTAKAQEQHDAYCRELERLGLRVLRTDVNARHPDSVFVEDTAVVVDELAVLTRPGVAGRRGEVDGIAHVLAAYRPLRRIAAPATLEGGDVLRIGRQVFVGLSPRTNQAGVRALAALLGPFGYRVTAVAIDGCLHLKTACTALDPETLLVNGRWLDLEPFGSFRIVEVDAREPWAANTLAVNGTIVMPGAFPCTAERLRYLGYRVVTLEMSELMKAEGGVTCSALIFEA